MSEEKVTLSDFANGGLEEVYQLKVQEVLQNVHNVNTPPDAKRKIVIELVFKPDDDRRTIVTAFVVKTSLANTKGGGTLLFTGDAKKDGKFPLVEHNPKQLRLSEIDKAGTQPAPEPKPESAPPTAQERA